VSGCSDIKGIYNANLGYVKDKGKFIVITDILSIGGRGVILVVSCVQYMGMLPLY
jgi:hypothetical protein